MTTLVAFTPSNASSPPFQATVTLDGVEYNLTAFWNVYRDTGNWYYSIVDQSGNVQITAPLIGSPPNGDIYLAPNVFAISTILYRPSTGNFEINP
ncbi:MAG TPA: hypothetical protein PLC74_13550 [Acetobacteraceae bacterium]|nr:hypothetical protein [Acetobacteraceae bacterium]